MKLPDGTMYMLKKRHHTGIVLKRLETDTTSRYTTHMLSKLFGLHLTFELSSVACTASYAYSTVHQQMAASSTPAIRKAVQKASFLRNFPICLAQR